MIRSLYSGVAGLKTQQTKMDVIGNNIANVGTYGFKSDRATFKDVYYQTTQTATASTGNVGGTNAKQIGYGNLVGSIDTNTKTSAMSSTGYGLDIAIAGEGFLQVMGADGNIMYTKAGMLDIDAEGNLVDVNGNFVLGVSGSDMTLPPSSNKIMIDLPYLDAQNSSVESTINQVDFTITSSNPTDKANVNFNFVSSNSLPIGQKMSAKISGDSIVVTLNAKEEFASIAEVNSELNKAIKAANGNVEHPAGDFTITMVPEQSKFQALDVNGTTPKKISLTGADIVSSNFGFIPGEVDIDPGLRNLFKVSSVGEGFTGDTRTTKWPAAANAATNDNPKDFKLVYKDDKLTITAGDYTGTISKDQLNSAGDVLMVKTGGLDTTDSYVLSFPSLATLKNSLLEIMNKSNAGQTTPPVTLSATVMDNTQTPPTQQNIASGSVTLANMLNSVGFEFSFTKAVSMQQSEPSRSLGLGQSAFKLTGGTEGGEQTVANLTSISIDQAGRLIGVHDIYGVVELGRIDLATFANPAGLQKVGNTYFQQSLNSGDPVVVEAGTEGTGQIMASTLEASNVDLSNEFSDMIMTQRGFQASSRVITVSDTMLEELINLKR